jgi:hypothetical protein
MVRTEAPLPKPEIAQARYQMVTDMKMFASWVLTPLRAIGDIPAQLTSNQVVRAVIGFARSVPMEGEALHLVFRTSCTMCGFAFARQIARGI